MLRTCRIQGVPRTRNNAVKKFQGETASKTSARRRSLGGRGYGIDVLVVACVSNIVVMDAIVELS